MIAALCAFLAASLSTLAIGVAGSAAQEGDADGGQTANEAWLSYAYEDLLGRQADDVGIDFWVGRLAAGGDRARLNVARQFVYSPEGASGEVERGFQTILGRSPDPQGGDFWTGFLMNNPVVTLRAALYSSNEVFANAGSTDAWIDLVYRDLLGRPPEVDGAAFWLEQIDAGMNRYVLVDFVYTSDEALGGRVDAYYTEVLDRLPTDAERAAGISVIRNFDERELRVQLISSDERFDGFVADVLSPVAVMSSEAAS